MAYGGRCLLPYNVELKWSVFDAIQLGFYWFLFDAKQHRLCWLLFDGGQRVYYVGPCLVPGNMDYVGSSLKPGNVDIIYTGLLCGAGILAVWTI